MTGHRFSTEARKGIAILAGAALLAAAGVMAVTAWHANLVQRIAGQQAERDLLEARAARKARDGAGRLTAADTPERLFLAGATPGLTMAGFQDLVGRAAAESGLTVIRIQPFEASAGTDNGTSYRLGIDAEGSLEQLVAFLAAAEGMLPLVFVTALDLQPQAAADAGDPYPSEALRASLRLEAHGWSASP